MEGGEGVRKFSYHSALRIEIHEISFAGNIRGPVESSGWASDARFQAIEEHGEIFSAYRMELGGEMVGTRKCVYVLKHSYRHAETS